MNDTALLIPDETGTKTALHILFTFNCGGKHYAVDAM